jgi:N-acetylglucosamine malate deacetylase 1
MPKKILVVSPHADDELIGLGGSLLKWKLEGHRIKLVLVACSDIYMRHLDTHVSSEIREQEFNKSSDVLATEPYTVLGLTDSRLDCEPIAELVRALDNELLEFKPDVYIYPEPSYHQDHQAVNKACTASLRPTTHIRPTTVMTYEIPTSTWVGSGQPFIPNLYIDISDTVQQKLDHFETIYTSQFTSSERGKLARDGILTHAQCRGFEASLKFAEAFKLLFSLGAF